MAATTRLTLDALMGRPVGSFAGKPESTDGPHPVGRLTRMDLMGLYTQLAGSFAGKAEAEAVVSYQKPIWRGSVRRR